MSTRRIQEVKILFSNVRSIAGKQKLTRLLKVVQGGPDINVLALCETHLNRQLELQGWTAVQTKNNRKGGALVATRLPHARAIKGLGTSMSWMSLSINHIPVHVLCVYLEPQNVKVVHETTKRIVLAIDKLQEDLPNSRILILGDFNEHRAHVTHQLAARGLAAAIPEGTPTHNRGGHLD